MSSCVRSGEKARHADIRLVWEFRLGLLIITMGLLAEEPRIIV